MTDSEPRSERSPGRDHPNRRQCPERGTHTKPTHSRKGQPETPTDRNQQSAACRDCSRQSAVPEGGDTTHAHARNDTPPTWPYPANGSNNLGTRRTHTAGTPRPSHPGRSGRFSSSPHSPHRPHPSRRNGRCHCHCRRERAGTPALSALSAPAAPAPATRPDPRHTGLRRCQPEPRPTRHPTPATPRRPHSHRSVAARPEPRPTRHPDPATDPRQPTHRSIAASLHPNRNSAPTRRHTGLRCSPLGRCQSEPRPTEPATTDRRCAWSPECRTREARWPP